MKWGTVHCEISLIASALPKTLKYSSGTGNSWSNQCGFCLIYNYIAVVDTWVNYRKYIN